MGSVPLRKMVLGRLLRVGMDPRLRVGTCLGDLEKRRRLLRLGTYGTRREYQHQYKSPGALLDFLTAQAHVPSQYAQAL